MSKVALVVIDTQVGMFEEPEGPFSDSDAVLGNISRLVEGARAIGAEVVFVQHCEGPNGVFVPGTRLFEVHPRVAPTEHEPVVCKWTPDSFHETDLREVLDARGVEGLVLCGMQTEFCVDTTCRRAFSLGYGVTLASDAHGTWDKEGLSAAAITAHHNAVLGAWFADVRDTRDIDFEALEGGSVQR